MKTTKPSPTEDTLQIYKSASDSDKLLMESIFGKEAFKESTEWLEVFEAFCKENKIDYTAFIDKYSILEKSGLARQMIKTINGIINGNWKADHKNKKQEKWFPIFTYDESGFGLSGTGYDGSTTDTGVGSRLCNENSKTAEMVGRKFVKIWEVMITTED